MSPQRITIHQFHYSTSAADAVTNHMILIRDSLAETGISGEIFAVENKAPESYGIRKFHPNKLWNADILLLHHSHGNPALSTVLRVEIPKALIYHNVTPDHFFAHDTYVRDLCRLGRAQLETIRDQVAKSFAVSEVNARELTKVGFDSVSLFPLLDLSAAEAPAVRESKRGKHSLLFVGKLTPHKNQKLLVETMFYLERMFPGRFVLNLIGRSDPLYGRYVRDLAIALGLEKCVRFLGPASAKTLEKEYRAASAMVCLSLHEGFCVPLVEAMGAGVPIFALSIPGTRETLGDAGVRAMTQKPHRLAALIEATLERPEAVREVLAGQRGRMQTLRTFQNRDRIRELCQELVGELRSTSPVGRRQKPSWFPLFRRVENPA